MDFLVLSSYLAIVVTVAILTYLWKENLFFRIIEHTYIGLASSYALVRASAIIQSSGIAPITDKGQILNIIMLVIGLLYLARLNSKYAYLSRWPAAIVAGVGYGVAMRGIIGSSIIEQLGALIRPVTTPDTFQNLNNFLAVVFCTAALFYYVFTLEVKGVWSWIPKLGLAVYMVTFGGGIGFELQGRISYTIERLQAILLAFGVG